MPKYGRADHNLVQRFQAHWFWRDDQISVCNGFQSFKTGDYRNGASFCASLLYLSGMLWSIERTSRSPWLGTQQQANLFV
jgi:hypothetical protein